MSVEEAVTTAEALRDALIAEVERAQGECEHLKTMDAGRLLERASLRENFNHRASVLERELVKHLSHAQAMFGAPDMGLKTLAHYAPEKIAVLDALITEIKKLAQELSRLDALNRQLAERSLTVVRAYLAAVTPRPSAYNRRGAAPAYAPAATHTLSWRG